MISSVKQHRKNFGRIAAQKAKQVVVQKIREEERKVLFDFYKTKEKDIVTGMVQRYSNGNYNINLGKIDAVLTPTGAGGKMKNFEPHERIKAIYYRSKRLLPGGPKNPYFPYSSGTGKKIVRVRSGRDPERCG